jgi:hypothetical protein
MMIWGDERRSRRARRLVTRWDSPLAVAAAVLWLVIVLWLGPRALDMEQAQERATIGGAR